MNIETLTVEFIRTGRVAADAIIHDEALGERLPKEMLPCLEQLRDRTCPPKNALLLMEPMQHAIEEKRVAVQRRSDAMNELGRSQEEAERRIVTLRMTKEMWALLGKATHDLLDALAAEDFVNAFSQSP